MSYAQIDDKILDCPKAQKAGEEATNLLLRMVIYCNSHLTDGEVPKAALWRVTSRTETERVPLLRALQKVGWITESDESFFVVGYLDHNPSRETVEARRAGAKARKERHISKTKGTRSKSVPRTEKFASSERPPLLSTPLVNSPLPPADAGGDSTGRRKRKDRPPSPEVDAIRAEVLALVGCDYPEAAWDGLRARLRDGATLDDAMAYVRWAATQDFQRDRQRLDPVMLFRASTYATGLAKAKARPPTKAANDEPAYARRML